MNEYGPFSFLAIVGSILEALTPSLTVINYGGYENEGSYSTGTNQKTQNLRKHYLNSKTALTSHYKSNNRIQQGYLKKKSTEYL